MTDSQVLDFSPSRMRGQRIYGWKSLQVIVEQVLPKWQIVGHPYAYYLSLCVIPLILEAAFDSLDPEERPAGIGNRWVQEQVRSFGLETSYLRSQTQDEFNFSLHAYRIIELAELLYNLQMVPGIDAIYRRLVSESGKIEATLVELAGFMLLWRAKLPFKVVHSGAGEGLKYECEVTLSSGITAYCEMKCKIETTKFSQASVRNTLGDARRQLPKGGCGIVFLKIPHEWGDSVETRIALDQVIHQVMRGSTRISEILCYERPLILDETQSFYPLTVKEYLNERSPYIVSLEGGLIQDRLETVGNTGWVPFWILTEEVLRQLFVVQIPESC